MAKNRNLREAKSAKNDEFYTRYEDICREFDRVLEKDPDFFRGKRILCPCDDPEHSAFVDYFMNHFDRFGLERLTCSSFNRGGTGVAQTVTSARNFRWDLKGDGDFRSPEVTELMRNSDMVVTNPPFSCYSADTEVLTDRGWKRFTQVKPDDLILSMDPATKKMEYAFIVRAYNTPYRGKLYRFRRRDMDLLVTDNHRMVCLERKELFCRADQVAPNYHSVPTRGFNYEWSGLHEEFFTLPGVVQRERYTHKEIQVPARKIPMGDWLEFFGFWLADGCCRFGKNTQGNPRYTVSIKQNEANSDYVIGLYEKIGFPCKVEKSKSSQNFNFTVYSKQLWTYLSQFGKATEKWIPREYLEMEPAYLKRLFDGYMHGDSHFNHAGGYASHVIGSVSPRLCEAMQELILKVTGTLVQFCFRKTNGNPYWEAVWSVDGTKQRSSYPEPDLVPYDGTVHCLELDRNHTMLVRRNGIATWCGNCFREFVDWVDGAGNKFYIIGNKNCVNYNGMFHMLRDGRVRLGYTSPEVFDTPNGESARVAGLCRWYTNMQNGREHPSLELSRVYDPASYPTYDNYAAINVDRVADIPKDYDGIMGVPITFFDHFDPDQFEVLGRSGDTDWAFNECDFFTPPPKERQEAFKKFYRNWRVQNSYLLDKDGMPRCIYYRVFIRRKK